MAYQLRDHHGATRSVAYLMLAAAPFVFVTGVVLTPHRPLAALIAVTVTSVVVALAGWICFARPHQMPVAFWLVVPFIATIFIAGIDLVTQDASTGGQLFYLWPVLYAASFLSRRVNYINLAVVFAAEASVVFPLQQPGHALSDWSAMTLAVSMTALVVVNLRDRADQLLRVLETQALADSLTGLANRRSYDDELARAGAWARRNDGRLALITIDVDHFKAINDTFGHAVGDRALRAVAAAMKSVATVEEDVVARLGGDEFVMLLRRDRAGAVLAAEDLRAAVAAIAVLPGGPPGVSIGVAVLPDDAATVEALVTASDTALYDAKTSGRGRVAVAVAQEPSAGRHNVERAVGAGEAQDRQSPDDTWNAVAGQPAARSRHSPDTPASRGA
jgi:diguanylate cyclase (GGDEF)-like protein